VQLNRFDRAVDSARAPACDVKVSGPNDR